MSDCLLFLKTQRQSQTDKNIINASTQSTVLEDWGKKNKLWFEEEKKCQAVNLS